MKTRIVFISLISIIVIYTSSGCIPSIDVPWFMEVSGADQFKDDIKTEINTKPVSIAVTSEDSRRTKPSLGKWLSWFPLAPYASDRHSGDPMPAFTCLDYRDVLPLLVAKDIRRSRIAQHSVVIDDKNINAIKDYELRLHLTITECTLTDTRITYSLSVFGMGLWLIGLPKGRSVIDIGVQWRLEQTRDSSIIAQGDIFRRTSMVESLYYLCSKGRGVFRGQGLNEEIHNTVFTEFSAEMLKQIHQALETKDEQFWRGISLRAK